jgi:hypothetical protein
MNGFLLRLAIRPEDRALALFCERTDVCQGPEHVKNNTAAADWWTGQAIIVKKSRQQRLNRSLLCHAIKQASRDY